MQCLTCGNDNPENAQFCGVCGTNLIAGESSVGTELPMVGFSDAIRRGFRNYFTFSGRATRAETWWWVLFTIIGSLIFGAIDGFIGIAGVPGVFQLIFGLATLIPSLAVSVRRLHDINRAAWWLFLPFGSWIMSFIGSGILLVSFLILDNVLILTVLGFTILIGFGILGVSASIILIVWAIKRGDKGPNKYGPDPRQEAPYPTTGF